MSPSPKLDKSSLHTFNLLGARIGNKPVTSLDALPPALIVTSEEELKNQSGRNVTFGVPILFNTTAAEIFHKFNIPIYQTPKKSIARDVIFSPPTFLIRQTGHDNLTNGGFFSVTPVLEKVYRNMTLLINGFPSMENQSTGIEQIKLKFAKDGTRVGLSFGTSSEIPTKFNITQPKSFNTTLFLNIDYIGNESSKSNLKKSKSLNLSSTESFFSSPEVTLQVSKSLNAEKLNDGCPKIKSGVFNDITRKWQPLNVTRSSTTDSESTCGYQLLIGHLSKFAVGDVVPPSQIQIS